MSSSLWRIQFHIQESSINNDLVLKPMYIGAVTQTFKKSLLDRESDK